MREIDSVLKQPQLLKTHKNKLVQYAKSLDITVTDVVDNALIYYIKNQKSLKLPDFPQPHRHNPDVIFWSIWVKADTLTRLRSVTTQKKSDNLLLHTAIINYIENQNLS
jgi:hypothetical protein